MKMERDAVEDHQKKNVKTVKKKTVKKEHGHGHGKNCKKEDGQHVGHHRGRCCHRRGQPRMMINGEEI